MQAKFFLGKPTAGQWRDLFASIKRALSKHPRLVELTIAMAADREDPRKPGEEWFMDEWDQQLEKWTDYAKSLNRTVIFSFLGKSEVAEAMSLEEHAGRYRWWFDQHLIGGKWLSDRLDEVISQVGPRYNQQLTVDVPAGRELVQFARLPRLLLDLDDLAAKATDLATRLTAADLSDYQVDKLIASLAVVPHPVRGAERVSGPHVTPDFDSWDERWTAVNADSESLFAKYPRSEPGRNGAPSAIRDAYQVSLRAMGLVRVDGPAYRASAMLLWGDAGAGKTHILCDTAAEALRNGQPAVVVLGQQLGAGQPWPQILDNLRFDGTPEEFLQALSARAEAVGQRALLLIDGINENNGPTLWPNQMAAFLTLIRRYPWIGVVLSVRTTARSFLVPSHLEQDELFPVEHTGFAEAPLAAVTAFFDYYGLPLPSAPLVLYQDLANPLLLRLYCQAATRQPGLLASPLPGLTRIIEAVLTDIDERARRALGSDPYQDIARPACQAIATTMRERGRQYLSRPEASALTNAAVPGFDRNEYLKTPLAILISEGLLSEDFVSGGTGNRPVPVVRFAFERIGDHLGAEALLDEASPPGSALDISLSAISDILASFSATQDAPGSLYRLRSALEALAVVLPERLSCELQDLVTILQPKIGPSSQAVSEWAESAWLRSLTTREPTAFTDATRKGLAELVIGAAEAAAYPLVGARRSAIRVALALSVHPDQPLGPRWLHSSLAPMVMSDRDCRWTAQIRGAPRSASPYSTLIRWCRTAPHELLAAATAHRRSFARLAAIALMWALPSSDRFLRDAATRAMVALADHDADVVTDLLEAATDVDDDYVLERVLAVMCASQLRGTANMSALVSHIRQFLDRRGLPNQVLSRDYLAVTLGSIASSLGDHPELERLAAAILPPYPANWPGPLGQPSFTTLKREHPPFPAEACDQSPLTDSIEQEADWRRNVSAGYVSVTSSLDHHGDFHTYVMHIDRPYSLRFARQRLDEQVSQAGLEDFDTESLTGWVFARVLELGWSPAIFGEVDADIRSEDSRRDSHKRERLGKKYQWLAWHEALARISGTHALRDETDLKRGIAYESAWQLPFARDLDPTHLCDLPATDAQNNWHIIWHNRRLTLDATVDAVAGEDGPISRTEPDRSAESNVPWWFPMPTRPQPNLPVSPDSAEALSAWATDSGGLPDLAPYLVVQADLEQWIQNGRYGRPALGPRYRLLTATFHLLEHSEDEYPYADVLISVDSALIRRADLPGIHQWPGTKPLDGFALDVSITDAIFLGEWPDSRSYLANCDPEFRPRSWQETANSDRLGLSIPAAVTTERYCWEGTTYDCSLPATLNVHLLTPAAAGLFPGIKQRDGIARNADGTLIHLDPRPAPDEDGTLLIDERLLAEALVREDLVLLQIIQQNKRVFLGMSDHRFAGETNLTRLIGTVGEEVLCDITKERILLARLE